MKYERLTKRAGFHKDIDLKDEWGYSHIYQRLSELENKIEDGTLVNLYEPYIVFDYTINGQNYYAIKYATEKEVRTNLLKEEAEAKLQELQGVGK